MPREFQGDEYLNEYEVATYLDLSLAFLRSLREHSDGPTYNVQGSDKILYKFSDVLEYEARSNHMSAICWTPR